LLNVNHVGYSFLSAKESMVLAFRADRHNISARRANAGSAAPHLPSISGKSSLRRTLAIIFRRPYASGDAPDASVRFRLRFDAQAMASGTRGRKVRSGTKMCPMGE
jgi:hypothetical protein